MNFLETMYRFALCAVLITASMPAEAAHVEGVLFPDVYIAENVELKIRGTGLLRYMLFVKAYVGGLYLPENVSADAALSEVPKRLEVEYFHAIKNQILGLK